MSDLPLTPDQLEAYRRHGHVTVADLIPESLVAAAIKDLEKWSQEFLTLMEPGQEQWFLEGGVSDGKVLRKLDNPVFARDEFRMLAGHTSLLCAVEQLIGPGLRVLFSQVFLKPAAGGGPKPVHQDNFYFGPNDLDGLVTAWIALDDATVENGCLCYADGSNTGPVLPHEAPPDEPFNLQVTADLAATFKMTPAPVSRGGVSFHHGNTLHQSSENTSGRPRRAVAMHFANRSTVFERPALTFDASVTVEFT